MKLYIGSDHAGFELKNVLKRWLKPQHSFIDLGIHVPERVDYPQIAVRLAKRVSGREAMGILVCGTGLGMSIVANKIPGARAAVIYDGFTAKMAREHNNANIACMGARNISMQKAILVADTFLTTDFAGKRHEKRVKQIDKIEEKQMKPRL